MYRSSNEQVQHICTYCMKVIERERISIIDTDKCAACAKLYEVPSSTRAVLNDDGTVAGVLKRSPVHFNNIVLAATDV